jgi:hypothetical protein
LELTTQRVRAGGRESVAPRVSAAGSPARNGTEPVKRALDVLLPPSLVSPVSRARDHDAASQRSAYGCTRGYTLLPAGAGWLNRFSQVLPCVTSVSHYYFPGAPGGLFLHDSLSALTSHDRPCYTGRRRSFSAGSQKFRSVLFTRRRLAGLFGRFTA